MDIIKTPIEGLLVLEPKVFGDSRGFFTEAWQKKRYEEAGIALEFVQDNRSYSQKGILRGLHFQQHFPQGKLISVVLGKVFDVAVDLRRNSKTFGHWYGVTLDGTSCRQLWIPPGFAHGFYVLSNSAFCEYKCTDFYHPEDEVSLAWDDKEIGILWPVPVGERPRLSTKDANALTFSAYLDREKVVRSY